ILVISNCRLGDALVMIPALRSLKALPARITLASEAAAPGIVAAEDILGGRGLVDCFVKMSTSGGFLARLLDRLRFFTKMRREKWDLGIVLIPPCPPLTMRLVKRLCTYLRLCGCRKIIAPQCIQANMQVAEMMLELLSQNGIAPIADGGLPELAKSTPNPLPPGKKYIAVAPGANMPVNCWALENYATVLKATAAKYNCTPVYFSGENERTICERLNEMVPGHTIIGRPLPKVECAMRQCQAYLGNDTGLIHLAAALGLPCIGIYSNRNPHGIWEPYTSQKLIFYPEDCDCAGCLKTQCDKMCINQTTPQKALSAIEASAFLQ
ncbi:MAG: glycosyltransferase family 9 protein, partial [Victivallales bacterium]|nr:glycosyltransferase family 9 protein [Victivallales bacterium]